ncbi:MAG TPA: hydrogenase 4 subunit F [Ktedonobacterales bacterium]
MNWLTLILLAPLVGAVVSFLAPTRWIAELAALGGTVVAVVAVVGASAEIVANGPTSALGGWIYADALSALTALVTAFISAVAALYSIGYLRVDTREQDTRRGPGLARIRHYYALLCLFVFSMLAVPLSNSLGVLWIAIEATTLASVFLVAFYRSAEALEAAWKYVIIGSVGIALALFGTVLTYYAGVHVLGSNYDLNWSVLAPVAGSLDPSAMRLAFLFIVVGFGTKTGLAPMHTWLPDAHSEAPSPVSALLSGVLLGAALYAILRYFALSVPSLGRAYPALLLLLFGLLSLLVATLFILRQRDYKRLLAYSSIEHMGLIAIGVAFGGSLGIYGALFQLVNHGVTKALLFFASGQVLLKYETKQVAKVTGIVRLMPVTGTLLVIACLAITGAPPFGIFTSEFTILGAGFHSGQTLAALAVLVMVVAIFIAFVGHWNQMLFGHPPEGVAAGEMSKLSLLAMLITAVLVVSLGIFLPAPLATLLHQAAAVLTAGGGS